MSTDQAEVPGDPPVEGDASVEQTEFSIWITVTLTADVPVYGTENAVVTQTVRCREDLLVRPCDYLEPVLEQLPPP